MDKNKLRESIFNGTAPKSAWLEEAKQRQDNEAWLDMSFAIALKILRFLRENGMTQKELAERLDTTPQYVNKIVKGTENLTLETIAKIEKALGIQLIKVVDTPAVYDHYEVMPSVHLSLGSRYRSAAVELSKKYDELPENEFTPSEIYENAA